MVAVAFLGDLGSGKTTLCTREVILTKRLHPEKIIYSNYHLYNYKYKDLDLMDLYLNHPEERNMIIAIDEIYTMFDSRLSSSNRNKIESYFIAMTRKAKADLFLTMQYETFTDCRLAPFVKVRYIMEHIQIKHNIVLNGVKYTYVKPHPYLFKATLYDDRNSSNPITKEFIFDGRRWFKEFNTDQYIKPPEDVLLRMKIKQMKDKVQYAKLEKQLEELNNDKDKKINDKKNISS